MQTICPHCQTVFKVSDEHLNAADGYVRCGICKEVFNALKKDPAAVKKAPAGKTVANTAEAGIAKTATPKTAASVRPAVQQSSARADAEEPNKPLSDSTAHSRTAENSAQQTTPVVDAAQADLFAEAPATKTEPASAPVATKVATPKTADTAIRAGTQTLRKTADPGKTPGGIPDKQIKSPVTTTPATAVTEAVSAPATKMESSPLINHPDDETEDTDLFDGVQSKLIPDEYRIPELHNTYSFWQDIAWSLAILVFTATLFAEYVWFNRNELIRDPQLRPLVTQFCAMANCDTMDLREPAKIEMTTRNIYSHPNVKNALMISGTLVNHAHFEQPYPNIQIDFSDVRGEVIASRIFTPEHYMQIKPSNLKLMLPEIPMDFNMEIQDPGKNAMTYEFSFL